METSRSKKHRKQLKEGDDYITLNRWDPELRFLLEDWCDDRLPESTFPFVKPPPPEEVASQVSR